MVKKHWIWCLHCNRTFEAMISRERKLDPDGERESPLSFIEDLEVQFGANRLRPRRREALRSLKKDFGLADDHLREGYAECPLENCNGNPLDWQWWDELAAHCGWPDVPEPGVAYQIPSTFYFTRSG